MTPEEIAVEFAEIFDDLPAEQVNEMLAKNIPFETIEFFSQYAEAFADGAGISGRGRRGAVSGEDVEAVGSDDECIIRVGRRRSRRPWHGDGRGGD